MPPKRALSLPPLPGTGTPPRGLFVSRWDVLIERSGAGFPTRLEDVRLHPRILEVLFRAGQSGWSIYTIGNEADVAHGKVSDTHWQAFHESYLLRMRAQGIHLTRDYAAVDHPDGKHPHDKESVFWFPNTGAFYHAAQEDGIVLTESWVVSADVVELCAAWRAGVHVAAIQTGARKEGGLAVEAEICARDGVQALLEVLAAAPSVGR